MNKEILFELKKGIEKKLKRYKTIGKFYIEAREEIESLGYVINITWTFGKRTKAYPNGSRYRYILLGADNKKDAEELEVLLKKIAKKYIHNKN